MALPTNWVDGIGMQVDADFLNDLGETVNGILAGAAKATVATSEATTSSSFTDLTTTTDTVTVTIGASGKALVLLSCGVTLSTSGGQGLMSYTVSGANTASASTAKAIGVKAWATGSFPVQPISGVFLETGLSAGSTTFKAKYATGEGSLSQAFKDRAITVIPL